jgi:hypothetical protein
MICWAPGPDVAIFYRHDGQTISGGFHVLGKIDVGAEEFCVPGPLQVTIELAAERHRAERCRHTLATTWSPTPPAAPESAAGRSRD